MDRFRGALPGAFASGRVFGSAVPLGFAARVSLGVSCGGFEWQAWGILHFRVAERAFRMAGVGKRDK